MIDDSRDRSVYKRNSKFYCFQRIQNLERKKVIFFVMWIYHLRCVFAQTQFASKMQKIFLLLLVREMFVLSLQCSKNMFWNPYSMWFYSGTFVSKFMQRWHYQIPMWFNILKEKHIFLLICWCVVRAPLEHLYDDSQLWPVWP